MSVWSCLLRLAGVLIFLAATGCGDVRADARLAPCANGITVEARYRRELPCDPDEGDNTLDLWVPKAFSRGHAQRLSDDMGATFQVGPRRYWFRDVDF